MAKHSARNSANPSDDHGRTEVGPEPDAGLLIPLEEMIVDASRRMLTLAENLPVDIATPWRGPYAPPIVFHVWHIARWSDRLQARLRNVQGLAKREERWIAQDLARAWRLPENLGYADTGTGIEFDDARNLVLPDSRRLSTYARDALTDLEIALPDLLLRHMSMPLEGFEDADLTVGQALTGHLSHVGRHLGMVEALVGIAGRSGTATS